MTALAPFVRLVDLTTNTVVATTQNVVAYSFESVLDASPKGTIHVPLHEAGDAHADEDSFATVLLRAAGGPGPASFPVPLRLDFSLSGPDGPTDWCTACFTVERKVASNELAIEVSSEDVYGTTYASLPAGGGRITFLGCSVQDVLGGAQGTIKPVDHTQWNRLLSADGTIPYLSGLLWTDGTGHPDGGVLPGLSTWSLEARNSLVYAPVCASAIAEQPAWVDSLADTVARAVQQVASRAGGIVVDGDASAGIPQGSRGHVCIDPSDQDVNLSAHVT